ncbi:hypothetical protein KC19_VG066800 [Ceratodon purpureus]|uniref:Uncharacterized protein n=1 Tax=Ceratodon purpureus TaxID=3225 RepID=A0A8T0HMP2_CERPU|nr:hypothetical protein KC19_VG066800 [Ceratodon purpureus]
MVPKRCRVIRARALRVHLEVRGSRRRGVVIWRRVFQKLGFLSTVKRRSRGGKNSMAKMSVAWRIASGSSMQQRTTSGEDDVEIPGDRVPVDGRLSDISRGICSQR